MYCANCGKVVSKKAKFCPHCGTTINEDIAAATIQPVTQPTNRLIRPAREKPPLWRSLLVLFFINLGLMLIAYLFRSSSTTNTDLKALAAIFGLVQLPIAIAFLVLLIAGAGKLLKIFGRWAWRKSLIYIKKKPIILLPAVGILVIIVLAAAYLFTCLNYNATMKQARLARDVAGEIVAAKLIGDALVQNTVPPTGFTLEQVNSAEKIEKSTLTNIKTTSRLADYKIVVGAWADQIAAGNAQNWKDIPSEPAQFNIKINDPRLKDSLLEAIGDAATLKEAGDSAIANKDREGMRFVAAKLIVLDHWLSSLETAQPASFLSLVRPAYAASFNRNVCVTYYAYVNGQRIVTKGCFGQVRDDIHNASNTAGKLYTSRLPQQYTATEAPTSETNPWNSAWQNFPPAATPEGGVGITQGVPSTPQISPRLQAFYNECRAKGGTTAVATSIKERIPTTESGTTCQYPVGGNSCWDYLTASGGRYMGGNAGCPELGLLSRVTPPFPQNITNNILNQVNQDFNDLGINNFNNNNNNTAQSWDGTYLLTTNVSCNVPGLASTGIIPSSETITVRNNRFTDSNGKAVSISSDGVAQSSMSINIIEGAATMVNNYQFYRAGGSVSVRGTMALSGGGSEVMYGQRISASVNCSGTLSGNRR